MKETLIIYRDWWEAIKSLPTDLQLEAWDAICAYAFEGTQTDNPVISAVTALMRSAVDRDKAKWEDVREKRREAGKRGLQKRWGKTSEEPTMANDSKNSNCQQMPKNKTPKETPTPEQEKPTSEPKPETPSKHEAEFERFRQMYPGSKRGFAVEFGNFKKKYPKTWKELIPLLVPAVERLLAYHKAATEANKAGAKIFIPNFAYLSTWINNARWEEEFQEIPSTTPKQPEPAKTEPEIEPSDFGGKQY